MKKITVLSLIALFLLASFLLAADRRDSKKNDQKDQTDTSHQPVIINMNRPSSGGHNKNFPAQQKQTTPRQNTKQPPVYGQLRTQPDNKTGQSVQKIKRPKPAVNIATPDNNKARSDVANASHHHPYEPNYVRKKLQKLGVVTAPGYIINREEIIHTDRAHSVISYPKEGFDRHPLTATAFSSRHFNDNTVRTHMALINNDTWQERIRGFNQTETHTGFYYWHNENGFNYCHYMDNSGYHWYGWYLGDKYFWTRHFNNRWWWYDADYDRWCFWNNNFWWWQDPYHIGDLYCYNDLNYIPSNSAEDSVAVTVPVNGNTRDFSSPDRTRTVKVVADTQDAFLYDTSSQPAFNPVYLASGVQDVMFSDPNNGKPLEIILKLNDQSYDMFDGSGNSYNSSSSEDDQ